MFQTMRYRFLHHLSVAVLLGLIGLLPANAWAQDASDTNVELLLLGTKGGPALLTPKRISQSSALIVDDEHNVDRAPIGNRRTENTAVAQAS